MRVSQLTEAQEAEEAAALGGKLERNRTAQVAVASKTRNNAFASPRVAQPLRCERIMAQASSDGAAFDLRLGQEVERETTASVRSADGTPPPFSSRNTQFRNRRPLHFARAVKPAPEAYKLEGGKPAGS